MFRNYLTIAFRNFIRHLGYSSINILGLSVGLMTAIFIFIWVADELGYDTFHSNRKDLYKVIHNAFYTDGTVETYQSTNAPLRDEVINQIPEVEYMIRTDWGSELLFEYEQKRAVVQGHWADKDFFKMFSFPIVQGETVEPLQSHNAVMISRKTAENFFPGEDPIGKVFRIGEKYDMKVTAVFENVPHNSTMTFDFVLPFEVFFQERAWMKNWGNSSNQSYVLLRPGADPEVVAKKMTDIVRKNCDGCINQPTLHRFDNLRLYSRYENGHVAGGRIEYVRIFTLVGIFILVIACINFMNLATARASMRSKEVGVRKVIGAQKRSLVIQFLGEALVISAISLLVSVALVEILMPYFNLVTAKNIHLNLSDPKISLGLVLITLVTGLLAGSYPAFFLASFKPATVLKGTLRSVLSGAGFRKVLVIFQFALSILLIIGSLVIKNQISYIRTKNLGFQRDNVLTFPIYEGLGKNIGAFKNEALEHPAIKSVTVSGHNPFDVQNSTTDPIWPGKEEGNMTPFKVITSDEDFLNTLGMNLLDGRNFQPADSDTINYLVNEAAAKMMGLAEPVGTPLEMWFGKGKIIGVVQDFHNGSLREEIAPLIFTYYPKNAWRVFVKLEGMETEQGMKHLETLFRKYDPAYPFDFTFLDAAFENQYRMEFTTSKLSAFFTIMAIFISSLGLFGLASFTAERRTKEFGVRKVLGASAAAIVFLLCKDFMKLLIIAMIVSFPVAYFLAEKFLNQYRYHTDLTSSVFIYTAVGIMVLALTTVGVHSAKAAVRNPVNALRME